VIVERPAATAGSEKGAQLAVHPGCSVLPALHCRPAVTVPRQPERIGRGVRLDRLLARAERS
jgi:hypothetical protein